MKTKHGTLKCETKYTVYVNWGEYIPPEDDRIDLQRLVCAEYGLDDVELESNNDTDYKVTIKGVEELDEYDRDSLNECLDKRYFHDYNLNDLLQDLVNRKVLPPANYVITVSW